MFFVMLTASAFAGEPPLGDWDAGAGFEAMAASVRADVEDYVAGVGMLKRPFARRALTRATAPCGSVRIYEAAQGLAITCDERKVAVAAPDGVQVDFTGDDGRTLALIHDIDADSAVLQTFTNRRGTRVNRFVALNDGGLRVEVTITSGLLDDALRYQLTYVP